MIIITTSLVAPIVKNYSKKNVITTKIELLPYFLKTEKDDPIVVIIILPTFFTREHTNYNNNK